MKGLEKRPDNRYASMDEFMQALADPVSYVEGHGGLDRFLSYGSGASPTPYPVTPGSGPFPMPQAPGIQQPTPPPGYMGAVGTAVPYTPSPVPGSLERPASNRGKIILAGLGAVALGVAVFVAYKMVAGKSEEKTKPTAASTAPATTGPVSSGGTSGDATDGQPAGTPPQTGKVKVDVASNPTGSEVFIGDVSKGKTPVSFELDRGDKPIDLVLKADGYEDRKESVVPNTNFNLDLQLKPLKVADGKDEGSKTGGTTDSGQGMGKKSGDNGKKSGSSSSSGKKSGSGTGKHGGKTTSAGDNTLPPSF